MGEYPSDGEIVRIREWPLGDPLGWLTFIRSIWWAADWGWTVETRAERVIHSVSTGGWSGNEEIIGAMRENRALWGRTWGSSRRGGGHYTFEYVNEPSGERIDVTE